MSRRYASLARPNRHSRRARERAARKYLNSLLLDDLEKVEVDHNILTWRARLGDSSWFVRSLSEYIAHKVDATDNCIGHFCETRCESQAVLDEATLITTVAHVDLNPIQT